MDIEAWLRGLGLGQYEQAFRDNEIDERVLPSLTAEDLKDLGVKLVGHRRRLLDAIAALGTSALAVPATTGTTAAVLRSDAERRQLTVMFCDLVGSTALSSRLDPEDLRGIMGSYHRCIAETVEGFGGFVARYMGDGMPHFYALLARASGIAGQSPSSQHGGGHLAADASLRNWTSSWGRNTTPTSSKAR